MRDRGMSIRCWWRSGGISFWKPHRLHNGTEDSTLPVAKYGALHYTPWWQVKENGECEKFTDPIAMDVFQMEKPY